MPSPSAGERKLVATNRKARFEYEILEKVEAGIALLGPEVKSLRAGNASLAEAWAVVRRGEVFLVGAHVSPYAQASRENPDPRRERKLLLHRAEITRLAGKVAERGLTLVPLSLYFQDGRAKVELALARGKERIDKRRDLAKRDADRQIERALKSRR